jgi:hypothetical protein
MLVRVINFASNKRQSLRRINFIEVVTHVKGKNELVQIKPHTMDFVNS